jgi:hypothetical protein
VERSGRSDSERIGIVDQRIGRSCREWIAIVESAKRLRFDHVGFFC